MTKPPCAARSWKNVMARQYDVAKAVALAREIGYPHRSQKI
jgi:hypothetical protein